MTIEKKSVSLASIQHLNLTQWLPVDITSNEIPLTFDKSQLAFTSTEYQALPATSACAEQLELVVFGDMTLDIFAGLLNECQLTLLSLQKINQRNNAISYRFSVQGEDIKLARDQLAKFNLAKQVESALFTNAQTLAQHDIIAW